MFKVLLQGNRKKSRSKRKKKTKNKSQNYRRILKHVMIKDKIFFRSKENNNNNVKIKPEIGRKTITLIIL